jgi:virginiamycin B lyase
MRAILVLAVALSLVLATPPAAPAQGVDIQEWDVPWPDTRPRDPYVGPDGRVWFVGQRADYAAWLDPETGRFERHDLPEGAGPHNLIVDEAGVVWYAGNRDRHIGRIDPGSGEITRFEMADPGARDPHTLVFGADGEIFFTVQGGNRVGRFDPGSGEARVVEVPTPGARPYGIVQAPDRTVWVVAFGTNKLVRVDPATLELEEVTLPRESARPRRLETTSDNRVWYVDYADGYLGVYEPVTGDVREWPLPRGAESRPYAMAVDASDRLWMVETGPRDAPNRFVGFDPATESFFAVTDIPSGGGTVRHMVYHQPTHSIWFGTDVNTIGRARLP